MQLLGVNPGTEHAFFSCLHLEAQGDLDFALYRREWHRDYCRKGYRAQVLALEDGSVVGKCHTILIENSPFVGEDLLAILCIYVHMYPSQNLGDQRYKGYGWFMLAEIESKARKSGYKGLVAWGMDWDVWNPVSFFEHLGYSRVDQEDRVVVVWKPFYEGVKPPKLLRIDNFPPRNQAKVNVLAADNRWCNSFHKLRTARDAIVGI